MNKPHVHAAVIKAWADGAKIQVAERHSGATWIDIKHTETPIWYENLDYRVKPETKTFRVALLMRRGEPEPWVILDSKQEAYHREEGQFIKWLTEPIEYEV